MNAQPQLMVMTPNPTRDQVDLLLRSIATVGPYLWIEREGGISEGKTANFHRPAQDVAADTFKVLLERLGAIACDESRWQANGGLLEQELTERLAAATANRKYFETLNKSAADAAIVDRKTLEALVGNAQLVENLADALLKINLKMPRRKKPATPPPKAPENEA